MVVLSLLMLGVPPTPAGSEEIVEPKPVVIETSLPEHCKPYLEEIYKYDWDPVVASEVMYAESRCHPWAVNKTDNHGLCFGSYGLFQISCTTSTTTDPSLNIKMAYEEKYMKGGWRHWSVCKPIGGRDPIVDCY